MAFLLGVRQGTAKLSTLAVKVAASSPMPLSSKNLQQKNQVIPHPTYDHHWG